VRRGVGREEIREFWQGRVGGRQTDNRTIEELNRQVKKEKERKKKGKRRGSLQKWSNPETKKRWNSELCPNESSNERHFIREPAFCWAPREKLIRRRRNEMN